MSKNVNLALLGTLDTTTPAGVYNGGYSGGVLLQDGSVYCVPRTSTIARIHKISYNVNFSPAALTGPYLNKY